MADDKRLFFVIRYSAFVIPSSFVISHSSLFSGLARGRSGSYSSAVGRPSDRPVEIVERSAFCLACLGRRPEPSHRQPRDRQVAGAGIRSPLRTISQSEVGGTPA